jgi:Ca-activated chloride channel family protein
MLAEDVSPNRLARAKLAALDLVRKAKTDRMGLVAFAGSAFLECPLTLDDAAFSQSVDSLDTHTISQGGTALAQAIEEARHAFKNDSENHKVLVLFTDGEDHDGQPVEAAKSAAEDGMIIFTIGIGSPEGEVLRVRDARGRVETIKDEQGQEVKSHLNESLLNDIAHATRLGFYLPLRGSKTMDTLYEQGIGRLPKSEGSSRIFQRYNERYYWPLSLAMVLLIVETFYPERRRWRSSSLVSSSSPAPAALLETAAVLLVLAIPLCMQAAGGASGALREYNQGKFEDSLRDYDKLLKGSKDDPRLQFNAGAAAYQSRQMEEAAKRFSNSLASPDLQMQQHSYYNLGNTLYRLGEQSSDTSKKQEAWENSIKQFDSALKLNQQDADAKFNQEFVQRQLEELKKQQQQQQQSNKNDQKQDQDKKDQKDQNQQQNKQDQNSQSQQNQNQSQTNQNSQSQNQQQNQGDQKKQDSDKSQAQNQKDQQDKKNENAQKQSSGEPQDKSAEDAAREAAMMAAGQMTPTQARQLLDAQKGDEQVFRLSPTNRQSSQVRSYKNW